MCGAAMIQEVEHPTEEFLAELRDYESRACAYSLQLFHDTGMFDLDQWMADFAACVSAYLCVSHKHARALVQART